MNCSWSTTQDKRSKGGREKTKGGNTKKRVKKSVNEKRVFRKNIKAQK